VRGRSLTSAPPRVNPVAGLTAAASRREAALIQPIRKARVAEEIADRIRVLILDGTLPAGQPLPVADLMRPAMVVRGASVQMLLQTAGLSLVAQGVAQETGATGERIRVLNPTSRALVEAEVIGPGRVRVRPETTPVAVAAQGARVLVQ